MDGYDLDGYRPGALAGIIGLHMAYYGPTWSFGAPFEAKLAAEMGAFLARHDPARDLFLTAWQGGLLAGAITIDGAAADAEGAHLRWFIVAADHRGSGLGKHLMARAVAFLDDMAYRRCHLTTFAGLDAARSLYERNGFALVTEDSADPWSGGVGMQTFERRATAP